MMIKRAESGYTHKIIGQMTYKKVDTVETIKNNIETSILVDH